MRLIKYKSQISMGNLVMIKTKDDEMIQGKVTGYTMGCPRISYGIYEEILYDHQNYDFKVYLLNKEDDPEYFL